MQLLASPRRIKTVEKKFRRFSWPGCEPDQVHVRFTRVKKNSGKFILGDLYHLQETAMPNKPPALPGCIIDHGSLVKRDPEKNPVKTV